MKVLNSFRNLAMYNFGVRVVKEMEEAERQYLSRTFRLLCLRKRLTSKMLLLYAS